MQKLALAVWLALTAGTLAGSTTSPAFPRMPVPAGASVSEAHVGLNKKLLDDARTAHSANVACTSCQAGRRISC